MKIAAKIFEKATVRGLADYLIYGLPPEPDGRDYNERLDATYNEFEKIALEHGPNGASDLLSTANDMACENACVYLEIGIQAGFLLIADMMKNIQGECQGYNDDEDSFASRAMAKDIRKALDILLDEDGDRQKAYEILERWGRQKAEPQEGDGGWPVWPVLFSDGIVPADMVFQYGNRKEADRRFIAAWRFLFFMLFSF